MAKTYALKKTLKGQIDRVSNDIVKLDEFIKNGKHVDYASCYAKLNELQSHLSDLEELNRICVERNRY